MTSSFSLVEFIFLAVFFGCLSALIAYDALGMVVRMINWLIDYFLFDKGCSDD